MKSHTTTTQNCSYLDEIELRQVVSFREHDREFNLSTTTRHRCERHRVFSFSSCCPRQHLKSIVTLILLTEHVALAINNLLNQYYSIKYVEYSVIYSFKK